MIHKEIYAIWLREFKKALADKWNVVLAIGWPLFLIFVIGVGIDSFVDVETLGIDYTTFLGPGIIALMTMGGAMSIGNSIIEDRQGFIKEMMVAPISRASIVIGKIFGEMSLNFVLIFFVIIIFLISIQSLSFIALLWAIILMLLISFGFYGLGIVLSHLFKRTKSYQMMSSVVIALIILLSGIFYPIKNLPLWIKIFATINPLTYGVDGLRRTLTGYGEFDLRFNLLILVFFALIMLLLGVHSFKRSIEV